MNSNTPYKNWCFTLNNPETNGPAPNTWNTDQISFLVFQHEIAPTDQTPHIQGYIEFKSRKRLATIKKINDKAHWEPRKGSRKQAIDYCSKLDTRAPDTEPFFYPEKPNTTEEPTNDKKKTLQFLKNDLDNNKSLKEIADDHFSLFLRHHKALQFYKQLQQAPREHKTYVLVIWGETGSGKTKFCNDKFPNAYWKTRGDWWDGYNNQHTVIIDEFYGWLKHDFLLRLLDRYPLQCEVKGAFIEFNSKLIIITSNKSPEDWYKQGNPQLLRRCDSIWYKKDFDSEFHVEKGNTEAEFLYEFKDEVTEHHDNPVQEISTQEFAQQITINSQDMDYIFNNINENE